MGSKGGTTSTTTNSIPPEVLAEYQNVTSQANQVAQTPYQSYSGPLVAGINDQQNAGIQGINNAAGIQNGYNNAAAGLTGASAQNINPTQFSAGQVAQYSSPYQQQVIDATLGQINNQNAQQQQALTGNAITAGAYGGDRAGVAKAALAGQQALATNSTLANLNNQNYEQALSEFNNQQTTGLGAAQNNAARQAAAGAQFGALGNTAQTEALTGAGQQINAGTLQQNTAQNQDTAAYNQFLQAQSFPYQQTGWLANIAEGIGSNSGGTSTTTSNGGSNASTALGGIGLLGSLFFNKGGRVPHLASGGVGGGVVPYSAMQDDSFVPTANLPIGHTMPVAPAAKPQANQLPTAQQMASLKKVGNGIGDKLGGLMNQPMDTTAGLGAAASDFSPVDWGGFGGLMKRGGRVQGFADGGSPDDLMFGDDVTYPQTFMQDVPKVAVPVPEAKAAGLLPADDAPLPPSRPAGLGGTPPDVVPVPKGGYVAHTAAGAPVSVGPDGYALGAASTGDDTFSRMLGQESGNRQFDSSGNVITSPKGATGIAQIMPSTGPEAAGLAGLPWDANRLKSDPAYNKALGQAYYQKQLETFGTPDRAAAAYNAGPGAVSMALAKADKQGGNWLSYLPAETQQYVSAVTGAQGGIASATHTPTGLGAAYADPAAGTHGQIAGDPVTSDASSGNFLSNFVNDKWGDPNAKPGLLGLKLSDNARTGLMAASLATMAGKSKNPWQNIGEGGLAGVQTYQNLQNQGAERGLKGAQTQQIQTDTQLKQRQLDLMKKAIDQNDKLFAGPSTAAAPATGHAIQTVAPDGKTAVQAPVAGTAAPANAQAQPQKSVDPLWDPERLAQAAEVWSLTDPKRAEGYRQRLNQISTSGIVRFADGTWGPLPGHPAAAKQQAEIASTQANTAKSNREETPGGTLVYDPANPTAPPKVVPLPGGEPDNGTGVAGTTANGIPLPTAMPQDRRMFSKPGAELASDESKKALETARTSYEGATQTRMQLEQMQHALGTLPTAGFLAPGPGFQARNDVMNKVNTALRGLGVSDNNLIANPSQVAAGEELKKLTNRMGFDLAKTLGGREPGFIVQQAVGSVPSGDNSPLGAKRLIAGIQALTSRQQDYYNFLQQWTARSGGSIYGADDYFNKVSPPEKYVQNAIISTIPPGAVSYLKQHPDTAKAFDQKFGATSQMVLSQ